LTSRACPLWCRRGDTGRAIFGKQDDRHCPVSPKQCRDGRSLPVDREHKRKDCRCSGQTQRSCRDGDRPARVGEVVDQQHRSRSARRQAQGRQLRHRSIRSAGDHRTLQNRWAGIEDRQAPVAYGRWRRSCSTRTGNPWLRCRNADCARGGQDVDVSTMSAASVRSWPRYVPGTSFLAAGAAKASPA
jgi:hypothetical protein